MNSVLWIQHVVVAVLIALSLIYAVCKLAPHYAARLQVAVMTILIEQKYGRYVLQILDRWLRSCKATDCCGDAGYNLCTSNCCSMSPCTCISRIPSPSLAQVNSVEVFSSGSVVHTVKISSNFNIERHEDCRKC